MTLRTSRSSREALTIRSRIVRSQYDPAGLLVDVHPQRDTVRVAPGGELDLANVATLQAQLDELRDAGFTQVVLDLRELAFMDSSAVRLILREDRIARSTGRRFSLIKGIPAVQRVLDVCGLTEELDFCDPRRAPAVARRAPARPASLDRPGLGIAFQSYLAQLRRQGRAATRLSPRRSGRTQAH